MVLQLETECNFLKILTHLQNEEKGAWHLDHLRYRAEAFLYDKTKVMAERMYSVDTMDFLNLGGVSGR